MESSPVGVLLGQVRTLQAGLCSSKPPKKAKKLPSQASGSQEPTEPPAKINEKLPPPIMCKKAKNTCNHIIVFGKHYNKALWAKYAESVKAKKSTVAIDPDYVA